MRRHILSLSSTCSRPGALVAGLALFLSGVVGIPSASASDFEPIPSFNFCGLSLPEGNCEAFVDDQLEEAFPSPAGPGCSGVPASPFQDRTAGTWREMAIMDCLAALPSPEDPFLRGNSSVDSGVTVVDANMDSNISRGQYVVTLMRSAAALKDESGSPLFPSAQPDRYVNPANPTFPDVPRHHVFYQEIETAVSIGLFAGTKVPDTSDVDGDGNTTETKFLPGSQISYAQIMKSDANLLTLAKSRRAFAGDVVFATGSTGLDCRAFQDELEMLEANGIVGASSDVPDDCNDPAKRGQALDALTGFTSLAVGNELLDNPYGPSGGQWFRVLPAEAMTVTDDDQAPDELTDQRVYTVTDALYETGHTILLFRADHLRITDRETIFLDDSGQPITSGGNAQTGTVLSRIVSVNGTAVTPTTSANAQPKDGLLQFVVDGNGAESVIPVVFYDSMDIRELELFGDGTSIELFGYGGTLTVGPGTPPDAPVITNTRSGETLVDFTLSGVVNGATVNVHWISDRGTEGIADEPACDPDTFTTVTFTDDQDAARTGYQVRVKNGLVPEEIYQFCITQTVDGRTSAYATSAAGVTWGGSPGEVWTRVIEKPSMLSITGEGVTDKVLVTFSEPGTFVDPTGFSMATTTSPLRTGVSAVPQDASQTMWLVTLDGTVPDEDYIPYLKANSFKDLDARGNDQFSS